MKNKESKIIPFYPIYTRSPNKFIRYEEENYTDESRQAIIRTAHYLDKNKNHQTMVAQVIWNIDF